MVNKITKKSVISVGLLISAFPAVEYIVSLKNKCDAIASDVDQINQEKTYITERIDEIIEKINEIKTNVEIIKHDLKRHEKTTTKE